MNCKLSELNGQYAGAVGQHHEGRWRQISDTGSRRSCYGVSGEFGVTALKRRRPDDNQASTPPHPDGEGVEEVLQRSILTFPALFFFNYSTMRRLPFWREQFPLSRRTSVLGHLSMHSNCVARSFRDPIVCAGHFW